MEDKVHLDRVKELALRLEAVIDTAIDGILTIDEIGTVETINPAAATLFGYRKEEVIGQNIKMLMPPPYREEHDGYMKRYLETRVPHIIGIGREVEGQRKDGSIFPLRLAVSEVEFGERRIFTGIIHDLSQVKAAQAEALILNRQLEQKNEELEKKVIERTEKLRKTVDQLILTNKRLENEIKERKIIEKALRHSETELKELLSKEMELSQLKSRFVSMASHEFRTPLSTILSSIELIEHYRKESDQDKRLKHINRIKDAVNYLIGVLQDFLSISRLEEGKIALKPEKFKLNDFCQEIIEAMDNQLKAGQELKHITEDQELEIELDKNCLRAIAFNLLSNASKYSSPNQAIECRTVVTNGRLKITVKDHGIGIPEEEQKHLFTRFFRATNVENIKGTGLGLNIVKRYVELLGGEIQFFSRTGQGTTFEIELPLTTIS